MNKRAVGKVGEDIATEWLLTNRFEIVLKNYYTPFGEIDLIAKKEGIVYFIEVKYRKSLKYGTAKEALTYKKISHIQKSVLYYIKSKKEYINYQISFIGIHEIKGEIEIEWLNNIYV